MSEGNQNDLYLIFILRAWVVAQMAAIQPAHSYTTSIRPSDSFVSLSELFSLLLTPVNKYFSVVHTTV
jgi:hypothetical protein